MKFKLLSTDIILFGYMLSLVFEYLLIQNALFVKICAKQQNIQNYGQLLNDFCERSTLNDTIKLAINDELTEVIHNYNLILFIVPLLSTLFLGSWSDLFGRRLPIILNLTGSSIVQMIMITFYRQENLEYFKYVVYGCAFVSGLTGSAATMIGSCYAYVTDVTSNKNMTNRLAILQTFSLLGSFVGYNLVALLISNVSISNQFQLGFSFLLFVHLCNIFISAIYVKLPKGQTSKLDFKSLLTGQHFLYNLEMIYKNGKFNTKLILFNLCAIASFYCLAIQQISLFVYLKRPPFSISTSLYGYFQASFFLVKGFSLVLLFPRLNKCSRTFFANKFARKFDQKKDANDKELNQMLNLDVLYQKTDILFCIISFISKFAGLLTIGLITNLNHIALIPIVFAFNEISMPTLRSLIVTQVNDDEKGKSLSLLSFFQNFCFFTGSILFKKSFMLSRHIDYGLTFDLVAIIQILAIVILIFMYKSYKVDFIR